MKANELVVIVNDFAGYSVSAFGEIRSMPKKWIAGSGAKMSHRGKLLKQDLSTGYPTVTFCVNGIHYRRLVHRVVASAFIPNPLNKPCVNHKDGDKKNNHVENLEWVSYSENEQHSFSCLGKRRRHSEDTRRKMSLIAKGRDMTIQVENSARARRGKPAHNRKKPL